MQGKHPILEEGGQSRTQSMWNEPREGFIMLSWIFIERERGGGRRSHFWHWELKTPLTCLSPVATIIPIRLFPRLVGDAETVERTFIHDIILRVFPCGALALLPFAVTILDSKTLQPSPNKTILRDPHMRLYFNVCIDFELAIVVIIAPFCRHLPMVYQRINRFGI